MKVLIAAALVTSISGPVLAEWPVVDDVNPKLVEAHEAYVKGEYARMNSLARDLYKDKNASKAELLNALELVDSAFAANKHYRLPVDFDIPDVIKDIEFKYQRSEHEGRIRYRASMKGEILRAGAIAQLRVVRNGDEVIMDKAKQIGEFTEELWEGQPEFSMQGTRTQNPLNDGLFEVFIILDNGEEHEFYFFTRHIASSSTPEVVAPAQNSVLTTEHPLVVGSSFRSPESRPWELRTLAVHLTEIFPEEETWKFRWGLYLRNPGKLSVNLGSDANEARQYKLIEAPYWLAVNFYEKRKFGRLKVNRASRVVREFSVDLP